LALLFTLTVAALSALGECRLDVYVSLFTLEYLVVLTLHSPLPSPTQRVLNALAAVLFACFIYIVAVRVLEILVGV